MEILRASKIDSKTIAKLHILEIPTGFLSQQSDKFLTALYKYLIKEEIVFVAKENEKVVGFIAGTITTSGLYKNFLLRNIPVLIIFLFRNILSIKFIKKAAETLFAPGKTATVSSETELPELLSIVVDKNYSGRSIGKKLIDTFEERLMQLNVKKYKVVVGANLKANNFYIKNGFFKQKEFYLHRGESSFLYIKEILN